MNNTEGDKHMQQMPIATTPPARRDRVEHASDIVIDAGGCHA